MSNKHLPLDEQPVELRDDLEPDPGIHSSRVLFVRTSGEDASLIGGGNTVEGDQENDGGNAGGISPGYVRDH